VTTLKKYHFPTLSGTLP